MSNSSPQRLLNNRGGGSIQDHQVTSEPPAHHSLRLNCPEGVIRQVTYTDPRYVASDIQGSPWAHMLRGDGLEPLPATLGLIDLLSGILTLPCPADLDFAIALDWTKVPINGVPPNQWANTEIGSLFHQGKYWYKEPKDAPLRREKGMAIVERLCAVVDQHPLLRGMDGIVAIPGHDAKVVSFGARIAAATARTRGTRFVRCAGVAAFRTPAKSLDLKDRAAAVANQFTCGEDVTGLRLLVVDDLYSSGSSASETARALRAAGASRVAALCAVRTMRFT